VAPFEEQIFKFLFFFMTLSIIHGTKTARDTAQGGQKMKHVNWMALPKNGGQQA
jgi:hypothetical protein